MKARLAVAIAVAALSVIPLTGVASAAITPGTRCLRAVAPSQYFSQIPPSQFTYLGGTDVNDSPFSPATLSPPVIETRQVYCGFGGNDFIGTNHGWTFAGNGDDYFGFNDGTFLGGNGNDRAYYHGTNRGVFIGNAGDDSTYSNEGRFDGGYGSDYVGYQSGTFNGGPNDDGVYFQNGTFNGGGGNDVVDFLWTGHFDGGPGNDVINHHVGGTCTNAVVLQGPPC